MKNVQPHSIGESKITMRYQFSSIKLAVYPLWVGIWITTNIFEGLLGRIHQIKNAHICWSSINFRNLFYLHMYAKNTWMTRFNIVRKKYWKQVNVIKKLRKYGNRHMSILFGGYLCLQCIPLFTQLFVSSDLSSSITSPQSPSVAML